MRAFKFKPIVFVLLPVLSWSVPSYAAPAVSKGEVELLPLNDSSTSVPLHGFAVSANGSTAGREYQNGRNTPVRATVWSVASRQEAAQLPTLESDKSGDATVRALSADGRIAAGSASSNNGTNRHATVWTGSNWQEAVDLEPTNTNGSAASAISNDGATVAGSAKIDSCTNRAAV